MKKIILFSSIILSLILSIILTLSCKKGDENSDPKQNLIENQVLTVEFVQVYMKYAYWGYKNENEINKPAKEVKDKFLLRFGNMVTVELRKKINDKIYLRVLLPDETTRLWLPEDAVTPKFITINKQGVDVYSLPNKTYRLDYRMAI